MARPNGWTREQLLIAFYLYCRIPFGRFHTSNPEIKFYADKIGRTPSALAMKLSNIASIDPAFLKSGRSGLASSSASDRAMWAEMQADWDNFSVAMEQAHQFFNTERSVDPQPADETEVDYSAEDRQRTIKVRVGQAVFREAVLSAYGSQCCISGVAIPEFLVASHIVPWSKETLHRKNPSNGLCLSVLHDKAFDRGWLCLNDDLTVRVSQRLKRVADAFTQKTLVAYDGQPILKPEKFWPEAEFLAFHRERVFVD